MLTQEIGLSLPALPHRRCTLRARHYLFIELTYLGALCGSDTYLKTVSIGAFTVTCLVSSPNHILLAVVSAQTFW